MKITKTKFNQFVNQLVQNEHRQAALLILFAGIGGVFFGYNSGYAAAERDFENETTTIRTQINPITEILIPDSTIKQK